MSMATLWHLRCSQETETMTQKPPPDREEVEKEEEELAISDARAYSGPDVTVFYDGGRCLHFAECVRGLPEVFDVEKRPWIQPQNASAEQAAEVVRRCPSGALHYRLQGPREDPERPTRAAVCGTPKGFLPATDNKIPRPLHGDTGRLDSGRCYLRRRTAYVRTPEPSSNAAAGRRIAGPPLFGSGLLPLPPPGAWVCSIMVVPPPPPPPIWVPPPPIMVVSCANATGARTSMTRRAAVARNIALFIQSSSSTSFSNQPAFALPPAEKVPTVYRTQTQKSPLF